MPGAAISVSGLRKSYGEHEAVGGIGFEVAAGEVFGFLGPNGAGKTTTIEILEGYRERDAGEVSVLGTDPARPSREWRERVGLVLQECQFEPLMKVREVVALYASFFSAPRDVDETIAMVGLEQKAGERIGRLSGGQKRRVDVAVGLVGDPDLIFLDEPTTGFDPSARRDSWNMIEGLKSLGKTVFLTTHYMDEAQHLADRVAVLKAGRIVAEGPTDELGSRLGMRTVISFRPPAGLDRERVAEALEGAPRDAGELLTIETDDPQRHVGRLIAYADSAGLRLEGLEVRRPSLEDVFLDLTRSEEAA